MPVNVKDALTYLLLFSLFCFALPNKFYEFDLNLFTAWASYSFENGLGNVYALSKNDYNPFYHYILYLYAVIAGSLEKIVFFKNYLKIFTLVFDFIGAIVAVSLVQKKHRRFALSLLLLFNIGYLYNTLIWGQVDGIFTCFAFISVVLALQNKPNWSVVFYILALNAKTQAIIFLPILFLLWLPGWVRFPKNTPLFFLTIIFTQFLLLIPFIWGGDQSYLDRIYYLNTNAIGRIPFVSFNAFNIWEYLLPNQELSTVSDENLFKGVSYRNWGLLMFFVSSLIAILPLFFLSVRNAVAKIAFSKEHFALVLLTTGLIPILFTYFNTEMHERYWHPAILFMAAYAFVARFYLIYVIASIAYFLNLESIIEYVKLYKRSVLIFDPDFIAGLFSLVIILSVWKIYQQLNLKLWVIESLDAVKNPNRNFFVPLNNGLSKNHKF